MAKLAVIGAEGGDPRLMLDEKDMDVLGAPGIATYTKPHLRRLHDNSVLFEEYHPYALLTRQEEEEAHSREPPTGVLDLMFPSKNSKGVGMDQRRASVVPQVNTTDKNQRMTITEEEWTNASRSIRTASMGAVFYLITCDVIGPFGLPYAFSLTGYGPGVVLYTVFGALAAYSATLIWQSFMGLDSYQFPLRNYGDIAYRLWGPWARYFFNFIQIVQLVGAVGLICISNGEALSEISQFKLCYAVCVLIWAIVGCLLGQIRTLQKLGWLANLSLWLNLLLCFITMGVAAHSDPLYSAYAASAGAVYDNGASVTPTGPNMDIYPPITKTAGLPAPNELPPSLVGLAQAIYAYGGAMVFTEFMAEMKRPRDFLKAVWSAQAVIYVCYMLYGLFIYSYQGQYTQNPSYLGISGYAWQTVGNVLAIITALIAATLYGNVGLKVIYNHVFMELFNAPPLTQRAGKLLWVFLIPTYWICAYIIGAAIPAFGAFNAILASACVLPITYVFPPFLSIAFESQKHAIRPEQGEGFNPETGVVTRHDNGMRRIIRGFFAGGFLKAAYNCWNLFYLLGACALWGLGLYAGGTALAAAFQEPQINAFSCTSPVAPS